MKVKKIFISLIFIILLNLTYIVNASNPNYEITKYDINIQVNDNNVLYITETINANFLENSHGITREIPINNTIKRKDGTVSKNYVDINNIKINEQYSYKKENGNIILKIGNPNETISGEKEYIINYTYNLGKDTGINYDELYFNLIGTKWNTTIDNITFTVQMPKEFDETKLGFTSGLEGSEDTSGVIYTIENNIISGSLNKKLGQYEGFTIRLELPEGYFINAKSNYDILIYLSFIIPILLVVITILWWLKYGKDYNVVETVEFNSPENLNSVTLGLIYNGKVSTVEVTSMLIELANKGYIKITSNNKEEYFFEKVKEYDGNLEEEKEFLNGLFPKTKKETKKVKMSIVVRNFMKTADKIIEIVENKKNIYFEKSSQNKGFIICLFCLIIFALTTINPIAKFIGLSSEIISVLVFNIIGFVIFISSFFIFREKMLRIISSIIGIGLYAISFFVFMDAILFDKIYFMAYIIGIISCLILSLFIKIMPRRTKKGNELYGKILGFRNFLNIAEKEQLEKQVELDPKYFYNILPYTYVLGVSDIWIKKFETITMQSADWIVSNNKELNHKIHLSFIGEFIERTNRSIKNKNRKSNSKNSFKHTGGGFSGGGSGGGGGSSW